MIRSWSNLFEVGWLVGYLPPSHLRYFVENMSPLGDSPYQVTLWKAIGDLQLLVGDKKVHKESPGPRIFAFLFWIQYFVPKKWRVVIIVIQLLFKGQKHVAPFIYDGRLAPSAEWREFVWFVGGLHREIPCEQSFLKVEIGDIGNNNLPPKSWVISSTKTRGCSSATVV